MDDFEAELAVREAEHIIDQEATHLQQSELLYQDTITYATGLAGCGTILLAAGGLVGGFRLHSNLLHITVDNIQAPLVITGGMVALTGLTGLIGANRQKKHLR